MTFISFNIRKLRTKAKMSRKELGNCLKVSHKTIESWENSRTEPSIEDIIALASIYNVSIDSLLTKQIS